MTLRFFILGSWVLPGSIAVTCCNMPLTPVLPTTLSDSAAHPIKLDFDLRTRYERSIDKLFANSGPDTSSLFGRAKVGAKFSNGPWEFRLQEQFAWGLNWTGSSYSATTNVDALEAYVRYKQDGGSWTVGRQRFTVDRLLGASSWSNFSSTFEGIRYQTEDWQAFYLGFAVSHSIPKHARLIGLSTQTGFGKLAYYFKTDDPAAGHTAIHTLMQSWSGEVFGGEAEFDIAGQVGRSSGKDHSAYAAHVAYSPNTGGVVKPTLEFNIASGGQSATHSRTFDDLYPSTHSEYGMLDATYWRNIQEFAIKAEAPLSGNLTFRAEYHRFWLFDAADGFYKGSSLNKGLSGNLIDPTGSSGRDLGSEIDLLLTLDTSGVEWLLGYSSFSPGNFIRSMNGGVSSTRGYWYLSAGYKF